MVNEELQIALHPDCKNDDFKVDFSRIEHDYLIVRAISEGPILGDLIKSCCQSGYDMDNLPHALSLLKELVSQYSDE